VASSKFPTVFLVLKPHEECWASMWLVENI